MGQEKHPFYIFGAGVVAGIIGTYSYFTFDIKEGYVKKEDIASYVKKANLNNSICSDLSLFDKTKISKYVINTGFTHLVCPEASNESNTCKDLSEYSQQELKRFIIKTDCEKTKDDVLRSTVVDKNSLYPDDRTPNQNDSRPTPYEIFDKIEAVKGESPFQSENLKKSYLGQQVQWTVYLGSISRITLKEKDYFLLHATYKHKSENYFPFPSIYFSIDPDKYSSIKTIGKDSKLLISGSIESVDELNIKLSNVEIKI